jgi:hypothetical protein
MGPSILRPSLAFLRGGDVDDPGNVFFFLSQASLTLGLLLDLATEPRSARRYLTRTGRRRSIPQSHCEHQCGVAGREGNTDDAHRVASAEPISSVPALCATGNFTRPQRVVGRSPPITTTTKTTAATTDDFCFSKRRGARAPPRLGAASSARVLRTLRTELYDREFSLAHRRPRPSQSGKHRCCCAPQQATPAALEPLLPFATAAELVLPTSPRSPRHGIVSRSDVRRGSKTADFAFDMGFRQIAAAHHA